MDRPTLLILSVGELGSSVLEAAARSGLFARIVIAGRDEGKAVARANSAAIGAGLEGWYPSVVGERLDVDDPAFVPRIRAIAPDIVLTTATLMPWWQVDRSTAAKLPFGGYVSLHLAVMKTFRDRLAEADLNAIWIGASYPDVLNPILHRTGFGPLCGIGNVAEPIPKLIAGLSRRLNTSPGAIAVKLVAQHAFEYHAFADAPTGDAPPFLLHAEADGADVTAMAREMLLAPFPFTYDLFFNRVTASAAIQAFRAFLSPGPTATHLPGVNGLVGGYPVIVRDGAATLDLHPSWSETEAIDTNRRSLPYEGIESIGPDGEVAFTEAAQAAFHRLLGKRVERVTIETAAHQAHDLLRALT
ncbi:MAG: hypothetical protein ACI9ZH_002424 [Paracoccaceae bacterium]|jgi:hypothetical protein